MSEYAIKPAYQIHFANAGPQFNKTLCCEIGAIIICENGSPNYSESEKWIYRKGEALFS